MRVTRLSLRDFRNYETLELDLPPGLAVVAGPNGAGKTNLLEAIYFGCAGRSPRTSNERELVRRGSAVTRVTVETSDDEASHLIEVGFEPGEAKRLRVDGSAVDSLSTTDARPLVSVFMPERLELVKGPPAGRRAHLDQVVAALWPARVLNSFV
jgi:DNA replication and repair protein RecF